MGLELLKQYRLLEHEEREIQEEIEQIEARLFSAKSPALEHIPGGTSILNALEELTIKHLELKEKEVAKLNEIYNIREEIERKLEALEANDRVILRARYLSKNKTVEEAAEELHYSRAHFYRLLETAERNFINKESEEEEHG